jgi:NADPH-dependent FMN reductase
MCAQASSRMPSSPRPNGMICARIGAGVAGSQVRWDDQAARAAIPGVVEHQAELVIDQAVLEIEGGSGVVVTLMCGLAGSAQVRLLEPVRSQADRVDVSGGCCCLRRHRRPSRRTGSALVIAEDSRSTSRQPSRCGAFSPSTSQRPAPSASSTLEQDPVADRPLIRALRVAPGAVPPFSEDLEAAPARAGVAELRQVIAEADAVLLATPEYNGSVPGQFKNAIDWASRPPRRGALQGKGDSRRRGRRGGGALSPGQRGAGDGQKAARLSLYRRGGGRRTRLGDDGQIRIVPPSTWPIIAGPDDSPGGSSAGGSAAEILWILI